MTGWLKDIPSDALALDEQAHIALIAREVWDHIDCYQVSIPTSPSAGRVYRRKSKTDPTNEWGPQHGHREPTLFIVRDCPGDDGHPNDGGQDHVPLVALIIEARAADTKEPHA